MPFTNLQKQDYTYWANDLTKAHWTVVCFCAQWCGSCRSWYESFSTLGKKYSDVSFLWIDIEDHADMLDELDVESFPCILIQYDDVVNFFGAIHPDIKIVERLLTDHQSYSEDEMRKRAVSTEERAEWQKTVNIQKLFERAAQLP